MKKITPPNMKDVYACLHCGYCAGQCPVANVTGWESYSPRGKVQWLKALANRGLVDRLRGRKLELDENFMKRLFSCTLCGRCEAVCHVNIKFLEFWEEAREWMVKNGHGPPGPAKDMYDNIFNKNFKNPFREPADKRDEWYRDDIEFRQKAEVLYFPGCNTSYYEYKLLKDNLKILQKAGVDFTVLGTDEMCCGAINLMMGNTKNFANIVNYTTKKIKEKGAKIIVTNCPGCYRAFQQYPRFSKSFDFKVLHTTEYYWKLIEDGRLTLAKEFKAKNLPIIYHDPCELGRISGVFDQPRDILKKVPGIDEVLEFESYRKQSICCGGGGGLKAVDMDIALRIAVNKVESAMLQEAATIVSACPACKANIDLGLQAKGEEMKKEGHKLKIKTRDIAEIIAKAI